MRTFNLDKALPWQKQDFGGKRMGKSVCVQRYGGFGDMLQMSSILPGLKEQGYNVTLNTTPAGLEIVRNDPHIDAVFLQTDGQVPNHELGYYWTMLSKCFDKFIMLSESVEGALLALPDRRESAWHPAYRRMIMSTVDYLEGTHAIADVPLPPRMAFYPSAAEEKWATNYRLKLDPRAFVIVWALSGSATHKVWPHMDMIIARTLLLYDHVKVVTVGDGLSQVIEYGWEKEKRVIKKSGKWGIRESLAFASHCDLVIGPETGTLNAVAMQDVPKILMLSHSGPLNIGGNWKNTYVMMPDNTPCYPCNILHKGFELCSRDEKTGTARCAANTDPEKVWSILEKEIDKKGLKKNEQHIPRTMREVPKARWDLGQRPGSGNRPGGHEREDHHLGSGR